MIGIAAVILTVGLGQGAQDQVKNAINSLGTNLLTVSPGSSTSSSGIRQGFGSASTLTQADATALGSTTVAPDIKAVAPVQSADESLSDDINSNTWTTTVAGTTPAWEQVRNRSISQGRFFTDPGRIRARRRRRCWAPTRRPSCSMASIRWARRST